MGSGRKEVSSTREVLLSVGLLSGPVRGLPEKGIAEEIIGPIGCRGVSVGLGRPFRTQRRVIEV